MVDYSTQIIDAFKRRREPMCIHQISEESNVKEHSVSGLVYSLELRGDLIKCNEGQKDKCKWFGGKHYFWSYAHKEEVEAKRSDEVGRMLRADHEKELKRLNLKHLDEVNELKTALNMARQPKKTEDVEIWKQRTRTLARMLHIFLEDMKL
jgi:hypothetical protein